MGFIDFTGNKYVLFLTDIWVSIIWSNIVPVLLWR